MADFTNIVGLIGVALILTAYFLLQIRKMDALSLKFPLFNFVGSSLILYSLLTYWNLASVVIEIAWMLISIIGIYKSSSEILRRKKRSS